MRAAVAIVAVGCHFQPGAAPTSDGGTPVDVRTADAPNADALPDAPQPPNAMMVQAIDPGYSTATVTIPISLTAGDLVLAAAYTSTLDRPIVLTDTASLAWVSVPAIVQAGSCAPMVQLFYAQVTATVSDSVTITQLSSAIGMHVVEYSGITASSPVDVTGGMVAPAASNTATTGTITTTATDMVFALLADLAGSGTMVAAGGWASRGTDVGFYTIIVDDAPGVAPGAYTATATLPAARSDACWTSAAIALRVR